MWFGCPVLFLPAFSCSSFFHFGLTQGFVCVCVLFLFCLFFIVGFSTVDLCLGVLWHNVFYVCILISLYRSHLVLFFCCLDDFLSKFCAIGLLVKPSSFHVFENICILPNFFFPECNL